MRNNAGRRERERTEAKLRIVEAARELFADGGEEALTLRRVAKKIEYSATTIYLHFRNKEALVRELCAADFATFSRRLIQADRLADPRERLGKVAAGYIDFGLQYPAQYRAMFITLGTNERETATSKEPAERKPRTRSHVEPSPHDQDAARKAPTEPQDFLQTAVFKALAAGVFKPEYRDVPLITQTLWCGLHGVVSLYQVRAKHPGVVWRPVKDLSELLIECLLGGMMVPSAAGQPTWRPA